MKKIAVIIILFLTISLMFVFVATTYSKNEKIIDSSKNHIIYDVSDKNEIKYFYEIFDNNKNVIDRDYVDNYAPNISYVSKNLIKCSVPYGTNATVCKYYQVETGQISEPVKNPITEKDNIVVFFSYENDKKMLIIKDIFNGILSKYNVDFSGAYGQVEKATIIDNVLEITYIKGNEYKTATEYFYIEQPESNSVIIN